MGNLSKLVSSEFTHDDFNPVISKLSSMNYSTEHLMLDLMQPCDLMIDNCTWLGKDIPCNQLFRVAKSSEGFCCSFNYKAPLDSLEMYFYLGGSETGIKYDYLCAFICSDVNTEVENQLDDPVYRVSGSGPHVGLDALIHVSSTSYVSYIKPYYGASILIHGPQMFPQSVDRATFGQPGYDVNVAIIPTVVISEAAIRTVPLKKRFCFFDDEVFHE